MEVVPSLGADKGHQVARVLELTTRAIPTGQVTAQGHQAFDAHGLERGKLAAHGVAGRTDTREVRCGADALLQYLADRAKGAFLGRATCTKSHRAELGLERVQRLAHGAQLDRPFRRLGREELHADRKFCGHGFQPFLACKKNSRLPSPPSTGLSNQACTFRPSSSQQSRRRCSTTP